MNCEHGRAYSGLQCDECHGGVVKHPRATPNITIPPELREYAEELAQARAEVERLKEFADDAGQYEDDINRWLPEYVFDEQDGANYRERIECAGQEIVTLRAANARLRAALEAADRLCDAIRFATPDVLPPHRRHDVVEVHKVILAALAPDTGASD